MKVLFTSEQVSKGHPDKICDQISDAILDACLEQDKDSRVAVETMIKNYDVFVAGEITTKANIDISQVVDRVLKDIDDDYLLNVITRTFINKQSPDIALGVDNEGAGDQGIMFGYACRETPQMMPLAWTLATEVLQRLDGLRKSYKFLKADAKAQVTIDYTDPNRPRIDTFLVSIQHTEDAEDHELKWLVGYAMEEVAIKHKFDLNFIRLINPTGRFVVGGSIGDAGVTGRKIIADTYGGYARHGGGAFSGKDPTKVDRSAAYMARYLAKWVLHKYHHLKECEIQLSYAIGVKRPVSIEVRSDRRSMPLIAEEIMQLFDLTPKGIIEFLDLKNTKYLETTCYGHFGKEDMTWEVIK
jgi:S-adenosylmethionine synthetase